MMTGPFTQHTYATQGLLRKIRIIHINMRTRRCRLISKKCCPSEINIMIKYVMGIEY